MEINFIGVYIYVFGSKLYAAESIHVAAMALDLPSVTVTQKGELAVFHILFLLSPDDRWCCRDMNRMSITIACYIIVVVRAFCR